LTLEYHAIHRPIPELPCDGRYRDAAAGTMAVLFLIVD